MLSSHEGFDTLRAIAYSGESCHAFRWEGCHLFRDQSCHPRSEATLAFTDLRRVAGDSQSRTNGNERVNIISFLFSWVTCANFAQVGQETRSRIFSWHRSRGHPGCSRFKPGSHQDTSGKGWFTAEAGVGKGPAFESGGWPMAKFGGVWELGWFSTQSFSNRSIRERR